MRNSEYTDSPYYLGNRENPPVKITIQTGYQTVSDELPWDVGSDDIMRSIYGMLVTFGFPEIGTLNAMKEFAEEKLEVLEPQEEETEHEDIV